MVYRAVAIKNQKSSKSNTVKKSGTHTKNMEKNLPKKPEKNTSYEKQIESIILFGLAILMLCITLISGENIWLALHNFMLGLFGTCSVLWPILLGYIAVSTSLGNTMKNISVKVWISCGVIVLFCSFIYVFSSSSKVDESFTFFEQLKYIYQEGINNEGSGLFGILIGGPLVWLCGLVGARIINIVLLFIFIMLLTSTSLIQLFHMLTKPVNAIKENVEKRNRVKEEFRKVKDFNIDVPINNNKNLENQSDTENVHFDRLKKAFDLKSNKDKNIFKEVDDANAEEWNNNAERNEDQNIAKVTAEFIEKSNKQKDIQESIEKIDEDKPIDIQNGSDKYYFPPIELLKKSIRQNDTAISEELQNNGQMLVDTLKSFNVQTKIINISRGPAVTRYELQPAVGVKISRITNLADDIALNLAASGVRIEAPIPGKAAVGIEIPNKIVDVVKMQELIASSAFNNASSKLTVVLGKDISGKIATTDLSKMPHLLIAGSTGSGKSVCINSFIISLLYKSTPDEVRLLMIDPKVVELGIYNGIPHLLVPVVTDPRKAAGSLNWAVNEMLKRYKLFAENNVRDISAFNAFVRSNPQAVDKEGQTLKVMPQVVIVIDELADLMMVAPNEVEDSICRLAQMARAAGMHLVIATQRPSVDVITGIIKANIPSRIALAVSSQVDSRTILDMSGAEKLLGRGDMLFSPIGASKPIRIQGCYVTDSEIESIVNFIKSSHDGEYDKEVIEEIEKNAVSKNENNDDNKPSSDEDPILQNAIKCVVEAGQASTSLLQRRLKVGYARAGRLIDEMEQKGVIGAYEGNKPRQVLITYQQYLEMNMNKAD